MIHTLDLSYKLDLLATNYVDVIAVFIKLMANGTGVPGIKVEINNQQAPHGRTTCLGVYCNLHIDALRLTGRRNLTTPDDYDLIAAQVNTLLAPAHLSINDMAVYRVDYCYNAIVPDQNTRSLLLRMYSKCNQSGGNMRVSHFKQQHPGAVQTINGAYSSNHKRGVQIYDKEAERQDKHIPPRDYEMGVLRLEYQTRWGEIKDAKHYDYGYWLNDNRAKSQLRKCAALFFYGDFYTVAAADKALLADGVSDLMRDKLHRYMVAISRYGVSAAADHCGCSAETARRYRSTLQEHHICPVPIPKAYGVSHIANPFSSLLLPAAPVPAALIKKPITQESEGEFRFHYQ